MSEPPANRRIILDLCWGAPDERTIAAAAEFAHLMGFDLLGVYVEDEAVHGLAGLPFAREFRLPSHDWGAIKAERIADQFRHAATRAQRMLAQAAATLGVASAFEVMRGDPTALVTLRSRAGDVLVFTEPRVPGERMIHGFLRLWQAALDSAASVLLVPFRLSRRRGAIAAVVTGPEDVALTTAAQIALAAGEPLLLLIPQRSAARRGQIVAAARAAGLTEKGIVTRALPSTSTDGILHALADCPERMVVLDHAVLTGPAGALPAIATHCGVPVLILDGARPAAKVA